MARKFQFQIRAELVLPEALRPKVIEGWFANLSEPYLLKPRLHESLHQVTARGRPVVVVRMEAWFGPLSEPVRLKPALHAAFHPAFFPDATLFKTPWTSEEAVTGTWAAESAAAGAWTGESPVGGAWTPEDPAC